MKTFRNKNNSMLTDWNLDIPPPTNQHGRILSSDSHCSDSVVFSLIAVFRFQPRKLDHEENKVKRLDSISLSGYLVWSLQSFVHIGVDLVCNKSHEVELVCAAAAPPLSYFFFSWRDYSPQRINVYIEAGAQT